MTVQPSPYDILRAIQDQQAVIEASQKATSRLVQMLAGMLDMSAPDPILTWPPALTSAEVAAQPRPRKPRRVAGPAGRPPATVTLAGIEVKTTARRAKIIGALLAEPRTLAAMVKAGFAPNANAMMRQIGDINADLERAGSQSRIKADARPRRTGGRGSVAPTYSLADAGADITTPEPFSSAQSEAEAGAKPEKGSDASAAGDGASFTAQSDQFVTLAGGEAATVAAGSPPEADKVPSIPEAVFDAMGIVAIDTKAHVIRGPLGDWQASAPVARTIARINSDGIFGLDVILKAGPWPGTDAFRERLRGIRSGLESIGAELIEVPKIGFRLRLKEAA